MVALGDGTGEAVRADGRMVAAGANIGKIVGSDVGLVTKGAIELGKIILGTVVPGMVVLGTVVPGIVVPGTVVLGAELGKPIGAGDSVIALGAEGGIVFKTDGGIVAFGRDVGIAVGADGVGRIDPDSDGFVVSSVNGAILGGDGAIGNKIGATDGRTLSIGAVGRVLLGMLGTDFPGARTESRI